MKKPLITFADFQKLDLRVGEIINCETVVGSDKLLKFTVNLGQDYGIVTILSGIKTWYKTKQLLHKKCLFVANLAPREIFNLESQGMILVYDLANQPVVIVAKKIIKAGTSLA